MKAENPSLEEPTDNEKVSNLYQWIRRILYTFTNEGLNFKFRVLISYAIQNFVT